jgi:hypothetical protein
MALSEENKMAYSQKARKKYNPPGDRINPSSKRLGCGVVKVSMKKGGRET